MACQPVWGYFMPRGLGIAYIVHFYLHFCIVFKIFFIHVLWYQVFLFNTNNLQIDLFDP